MAAVRSFVRRRRVEKELDAELQFHLEQMEDAAVSRGASNAEALLRARRHMGSVDSVKEGCRDTRPLRPLEHFLRDLQFGARLLVRAPGFATVTLLSLALGIGASSSIYSLINAIVLRPLPVTAAHELHIAQIVEPHEVDLLFSYPVLERASSLLAGRAELAAQTSTETVLVAIDGRSAHVPEPARLQLVAGAYFETLRQQPQVGRLLSAADHRLTGASPLAVISDRYWTRRFGRSTSVLDTELNVNGTAVAIVGVAAPEFYGATVERETPDIWMPATMQAALRFAGNFERTGGDPLRPWALQPEFSWLQIMARVPAGAAPAVAEALTLAVYQDRTAENPEDVRRRIPVTLTSGAAGFSSVRSELATSLVVLLLMVALLLVIACANIASLLLARATSRSREMAIRVSMGAGRRRLITQLLTESLILAAAGGLLGLALAYWGSGALLALLLRGMPVTGIDVRPDWQVVAVTFAIAIGTALAFGLLPAWRGTRAVSAAGLQLRTPGLGGAERTGRLPIGKFLVAGQMALAILLLMGAVLFARSLQAMGRVDVGFDRQHLLVARIDARSSGYEVRELPALHARIVERLGSLHGVIAVSLSANGPFGGATSRGTFQAEGYTPAPGEEVRKQSEWVTPDYFRAVGLTVTRGRDFGPQDTASGRRVSVINETMARRFFPGQDPVGRRWGDSAAFDVDGIEIVGVVEDARYNGVKTGAPSMSYVPAVQTERYLRSLEIRTSGNPEALIEAVRTALRESEPRLAVGAIETLDTRVVRSMAVERLLGWLTMAFGVAALSLACLGLYGTIAYGVRRRTAELGLRIALGADRTTVQWLIVREALVLVLVGVAIGLPLALLAARAIGGLLYATAPADPVAAGTAAGVLIVVSVLAAYIPAWRASRLHPMTALRAE